MHDTGRYIVPSGSRRSLGVSRLSVLRFITGAARRKSGTIAALPIAAALEPDCSHGWRSIQPLGALQGREIELCENGCQT